MSSAKRIICFRMEAMHYDLFDDVQNLEREYEDMQKNPVIQEYLAAELQICRIIQRCADEILTSVDMEIENFADIIETD